MQNAFDVFRSRTPVFPVRGGNLYHYAILADMYTYILAVYNPYFNLYVHICTYVHIRAYTYIYEHIYTDTCIYVHIRLYTYIFNHHQIVVGRCFGGEAADVFWQQYEISPTRSAVMGHETGSQCSDMARGTAQQSRGVVQKGHWTRAEGVRKIGSAKVSPTTEKNACPDALGCPEWGPLAAVHRECVLGNWHQLPCFRGS